MLIWWVKDFGATLLLAILWISASGALSKGISNLSTASDVKEWISDDKTSICANHGCTGFYSGSFSKLVVTVVSPFTTRKNPFKTKVVLGESHLKASNNFFNQVVEIFGPEPSAGEK